MMKTCPKHPFDKISSRPKALRSLFAAALTLLLLLTLLPVQAAPGEAQAQGFASVVKVSLTLHSDGSIAALTVDASGETPNLGSRAAEEAFTSQFIGRKGPFSLNLDGVSGATVSSQAVVDALNTVLPAAAIPGSRLIATAQGFAGTIRVTVVMGQGGAIAALTVDASGETPNLGSRVAEEAFTSQFIGQTGPFSLGIDAVSGATVTSQAVVDAINAALIAASSVQAAPAEAFPAYPKSCDFRMDDSADPAEDGKSCEFKME